MYNRIITLIWKELLGIWNDPKSRTAILIPPVIQLFIFTFAATLDVKNVPIGILNRDGGAVAYELVERFYGAPTFNKIVHLHAEEEITPFIDNQEGVMVVSMDEQFSRNIAAGKTGYVQLILDGRKSNTAQIVAGYAENIIQQYNKDLAKLKRVELQHAELVPRYWYNPNLLYYWYNVPCLSGILSMLSALIVTTISVARERELGTFDQILVSPLLPFEILVGKMIPGIIVGVLEGSIILVVGVGVFQVPFTGSLLLFYSSLVVFICCIVGVGLFISSLCSTQQQASLGTFIFMSPSILLSGFATPIENMPLWLQPVTYFNPLRYMLVICKGVYLKAMPLSIVLENVWPMAIIALFTLSAASFLFRRRLE